MTSSVEHNTIANQPPKMRTSKMTDLNKRLWQRGEELRCESDLLHAARARIRRLEYYLRKLAERGGEPLECRVGERIGDARALQRDFPGLRLFHNGQLVEDEDVEDDHRP